MQSPHTTIQLMKLLCVEIGGVNSIYLPCLSEGMKGSKKEKTYSLIFITSALRASNPISFSMCYQMFVSTLYHVLFFPQTAHRPLCCCLVMSLFKIAVQFISREDAAQSGPSGGDPATLTPTTQFTPPCSHIRDNDMHHPTRACCYYSRDRESDRQTDCISSGCQHKRPQATL